MLARLRTVGGVEVLELSGKITIADGEGDLHRLVQGLLEAGRTHILISLERVGFMDSGGLGELIACYKRATERGGIIKLLRPTGKVADLLSLSKMTELLEVFQDEGEAIASF